MSLLRRALETVRVLAQVRRERRVPYLPEAEVPRIGFSCEERRGTHLHADLSQVRIVGDEVRVDVEWVAAVERQPGGKVTFIAALPGS